jgi:hypothetical protein
MGELEELADAIKRLHGVAAVHTDSVGVCEISRGKVIWDGTVEVFELVGHPKAKRCYAWKHWEDEKGMQTRVVIALEVAPIDSPFAVVRRYNSGPRLAR